MPEHEEDRPQENTKKRRGQANASGDSPKTKKPKLAAQDESELEDTNTPSESKVPADDQLRNEENKDILVPTTKRTSAAIEEERQGIIKFRIVVNDGRRESMILLTGLKNIFQRQLPKMPKEYIARLVYDRHHVSIAVVKDPLRVVGGITYKPFYDRKFAEIVFCAIESTEQVKGYGARLMCQLKDHVALADIRHFLTYADNYAIGYFKKQGFTTEIGLDKSVWMGYIKDYEGGTLMQCTMLPKIKYLDVFDILHTQKEAVLQKIKALTKSHKVYPGLKFTGKKTFKPEDIPGVKEAGWTPEMANLRRRPPPIQRAPFWPLMNSLVAELQGHPSAWPFAEPVTNVPDYYEVIKEPMDLRTLQQKVEANSYDNLQEFIEDVNKIFKNCKFYNDETTLYFKNAIKLEKFFNEKLKLKRAELGL